MRSGVRNQTDGIGLSGGGDSMTLVSALRFAVGYAAVAATIPYLALKVMWISGSSIGMTDPSYFSENPEYFFGNILTVGMDLIAVAIALSFTHEWGSHLPAWLVLPPTWVATGFLGPIILLMPLAPIAFADVAVEPGPLRGWVYLFVYGGFAAQGLLLSVAFVMYAARRWGRMLSERSGAVSVKTRNYSALATISLMTLVGALHLLWAFGARTGLSEAFVSEAPSAFRLTSGVYALFALAGATGLTMLVHSFPRGLPLWVPISLTWLGTGSLLAWGLWQFVTIAVTPEFGTPLLAAAMLVKVLSAILTATLAVMVIRNTSRRTDRYVGERPDVTCSDHEEAMNRCVY